MAWWPEHPPEVPRTRLSRVLPTDCVFPSGRAAIAQVLQAIDLSPNAWVAVPTHSSECLVRIVRRFGIPLDISAIDPTVQAAVVYEQWGWPLTLAAWAELNARHKGSLLLVDRVDSADFFSRATPPGSVDVLSLSKLLGIAGGGVARANGTFLIFEGQAESDATRRLRQRPIADLAGGGYREFFKETRQAVHPAAAEWLGRNCLQTAIEGERIARQRHLDALLESSLSANWPVWMLHALANGAGPVWAPVLRGHAAATRWTAMRRLHHLYGVASASRLFNWAGDPLRPRYEVCLALPVHSGVANFREIVAALASAGEAESE